MLFRLLDVVVTTSLSVRKVWGARPGPVKSDTVSPGTRHRSCFLRTSKLSCLGAVAALDYFKQVSYMIRKAGQNKYSL